MSVKALRPEDRSVQLCRMTFDTSKFIRPCDAPNCQGGSKCSNREWSLDPS